MGPDPYAPAPIAPPVQAMPQMKEGPTQQAGGGGFWGGLNKGFDTLNSSPLFALSMSLLGNAQGSNWAGVNQDWSRFNRDRREQQAAENETRRMKTAEGRDQTLWDRQEQQYGAQQRVFGGLSPQERAMAEADPESFFAARAQAGAPITPYQQRQLELEERQISEAAAARRQQMTYQQSQDQWMRRFQGALGAADAGSVAEQGALVRQGITQVRPILQEMRSIIQRYPDIMGSWINTNDRTQLVRMAGGDPARLAAMERFQGLATQLTLPQLEALRPATNLDFERVRATIADPQMSQQGALAYLDSQDQALERALQVSESQGQWVSQYGSLSMPNESGQTWASAVRDAPFMQFNSTTPESIGGGGAAPARAPQRGDVVEGYRFLGGNPADRSRWVRVSGVNGDNSRRDSQGNWMLR